MRRFINSLPGRIFSQIAILALLMPTLTLALMGRATAQVATPTDFIAVLEFVNAREATGTEYGQRATSAIIAEYSKLNDPTIELVPQETIARAVQTLGINNPPQGTVNLLRLGQEVRATKLVTGDVVNYRVNAGASGKSADVVLRVVVYDVASGLPINGSVVSGQSTTRPADVADTVLINDAIAQAASTAVREIRARALPVGTVLTTTTTRVNVNQGSRSGFKPGQSVIIKRQGEQVASGRVSEVEFDASVVVPDRVLKGVRPGDRVEVIFSVPQVTGTIQPNGQPGVVRTRRSGNNSGLVTTLVVLALVGFLVANGGSGSNSPASSVTAEAYAGDDIAISESSVIVSWRVNAFSNGNNKVRWQIFRDDVNDAPVAVVGGDRSSYVDRSTNTGGAFSWLDGSEISGAIRCVANSSNRNGVFVPVTTGRPYQYAVELVQSVDRLNDPNLNSNTNTTTTGSTATGTTTTTGSTASTTTTTGTTATTTTGTTTATTTGTTSQIVCFTVSDRQNARGLATPLARPVISAPTDGAQIQGNQVFQFTVNASTSFALSLESVLEFSDSRSFPKNRTFRVASSNNTRVGSNAFPSINVSASSLPGYIRNATTVYYRIGIRNAADRPGPRKIGNSERYIYSVPRSYVPPVGPPPPP